MTRTLRKLSFSTVLAVLAAAGILFPSQGSIVCIAPGDHVAIEEINSGCCASLEIPSSAPGPQWLDAGGVAQCRDCRDFLITLTGGAPLESRFSAPENSAAIDWVEDSLSTPVIWFTLFGRSATDPIASRILLSSAIPLRC